jgi:hypothetical protein
MNLPLTSTKATIVDRFLSLAMNTHSGFLLLLLLVAPAVIKGDQAADDLFTDLHCDLKLYINSIVQPDQAPYDASQDPSELVTTRETVIKAAFNDSTYLGQYYIVINAASVKAYCYNDSTPTVLQPFGPIAYNGDLIKAVSTRLGGLAECRGIPGCDGFTLQTLVFYRQFPLACTRFRIELDANIYEDADAAALSSSSPSLMSSSSETKKPAFYSKLGKKAGLFSAGGGGRLSVLSATLPENVTLLGTTDTLVYVINSTADDRNKAHATDESTTAFELGLLLPVGILFGVLFIVVIGVAISNANKASIAAKAAGTSNVSGRTHYSDNVSLISDGKRSSDAEMQGTQRFRQPRTAGVYSGYN